MKKLSELNNLTVGYALQLIRYNSNVIYGICCKPIDFPYFVENGKIYYETESEKPC